MENKKGAPKGAPFVIASAAKQPESCDELDCFVVALLAMTWLIKRERICASGA
jgi:hypothetical protein